MPPEEDGGPDVPHDPNFDDPEDASEPEVRDWPEYQLRAIEGKPDGVMPVPDFLRTIASRCNGAIAFGRQQIRAFHSRSVDDIAGKYGDDPAIKQLVEAARKEDLALAIFDMPEDDGPFQLPPSMATIYEHARAMRDILEPPSPR